MNKYLLPWAVWALGTQAQSLGAAVPWVWAAPPLESRLQRRVLFKYTIKKISHRYAVSQSCVEWGIRHGGKTEEFGWSNQKDWEQRISHLKWAKRQLDCDIRNYNPLWLATWRDWVWDEEHGWLEAGGGMADELMSGVFVYLITCHTSQEVKRQFMFLTSAHQQTSSGSVSLRGWQPMTGSGTPLVPLAEICAIMQFSFCWGKRVIEMEFVPFQLVVILPAFFLLKKINNLLKNITKIAKSSNWNKEIAESKKLCLFCLINFS